MPLFFNNSCWGQRFIISIPANPSVSADPCTAGRRGEVQTEFAIEFPLASRFGLGSLFPTIQTLCPYRPAPHIRQLYIVRSLPCGCISLPVLLFCRLPRLVSLQLHKHYPSHRVRCPLSYLSPPPFPPPRSLPRCVPVSDMTVPDTHKQARNLDQVRLS